jgi:hypothetical protein
MEEHNSVYLAWQAPDTREWHVVGMLRQRQQEYTFNYTVGAQASSKFIPFSGMEDVEKTYVSTDLFPLFKNRLLSKRRPEYPRFIEWLGLANEDVSPINVLGRSGALRGTDHLQMFKRIEIKNDGSFEHIFFAHGLSHLPASASERVSNLTKGEQLYLCLDCQNPFDGNAVLILANNPAEIVGYCPRYIAKYINEFLRSDSSSVTIYVEALSKNAPSNYRLMCQLKGKVHPGLANNFMNREEFQLIPLTVN